MEKAYAKMHKSYEVIFDSNFVEGLVDLTGGVAEKWILTDKDVQKKIETNQMWELLKSHFNQKFYLGCINFIEGKVFNTSF